MIGKGPNKPSIARQCRLLGLSRSGFYHRPKACKTDDLALLRLLDEESLWTPFSGSRRMTVHLRRLGRCVNRKRVCRLMRRLGLQAIYARPRTSTPHLEHKAYPYLLRDVAVTSPRMERSSRVPAKPHSHGGTGGARTGSVGARGRTRDGPALSLASTPVLLIRSTRPGGGVRVFLRQGFSCPVQPRVRQRNCPRRREVTG